MADSDDDVSFESADEEAEIEVVQQNEKADKLKPEDSLKSSPTSTNDKELSVDTTSHISEARREEKETQLAAGESAERQSDTVDESPDKGTEAQDPRINTEKNPATTSDIAFRTRQTSRGSTDSSSVETVDVKDKDPKSALMKLTGDDEDEKESGWGWNSLSSWGTSVLHTASSSVSTLTNQVGTGLNQVLHTVETGFSEPVDESTDEVSLSEGSAVRRNEAVSTDGDTKVITKQIDRTSVDDAMIDSVKEPVEESEGEREAKDGEGWFTSWGLSGLGDVVHKTTNVVQSTVQQTTGVSKKVVSGGLDVLETIGKKTFDILTECDHGLKKVIELNRSNKPNLSESLREAKEDAEKRAKEEEEFVESRKAHFGAQFDDYQGLVQLEALEMLSSNSEGRLKKVLEVLPDEASETLRPQLIDIKLTFDNINIDSEEAGDAEHDFNKLVMNYRGDMSLNISVQKLLTAQQEAQEWLNKFDEVQSSDHPRTSTDIHHKAIQSLAILTAYTIEHFHRASLLILQDTCPTPASYQAMAVCLANLTKVVCDEVGHLSTHFVQCLTTLASKQNEETSTTTEIVANVYLESGNSCTYVHDAFQLLLPVLQLSAIKSHPLCTDLIEK